MNLNSRIESGLNEHRRSASTLFHLLFLSFTLAIVLPIQARASGLEPVRTFSAGIIAADHDGEGGGKGTARALPVQFSIGFLDCDHKDKSEHQLFCKTTMSTCYNKNKWYKSHEISHCQIKYNQCMRAWGEGR